MVVISGIGCISGAWSFLSQYSLISYEIGRQYTMYMYRHCLISNIVVMIQFFYFKDGTVVSMTLIYTSYKSVLLFLCQENFFNWFFKFLKILIFHRDLWSELGVFSGSLFQYVLSCFMVCGTGNPNEAKLCSFDMFSIES